MDKKEPNELPRYAAETQEERVRHPRMREPHRCNPYALRFMDGFFERPLILRQPLMDLVRCLSGRDPTVESGGLETEEPRS
mmetsp:Transcript_15362/g.31161  ORF Transcript_15362/g.31161 Transcript_15362/m.31161 type:complete len:81 (+) Transcript_15362:109-351(+)